MRSITVSTRPETQASAPRTGVSRRHALVALGAALSGAGPHRMGYTQARKLGHLVVVGGAEDREVGSAVWNRFVELSGGPDARILLCTAASGDPEGAWTGYQPLLQSLGLTHAEHLLLRSPEEANRPDVAERILGADGVFLTGGDQRRLMGCLWETAAARALHQAFHLRGCTIGGTSAGAAVMSRTMLAIGQAPIRPEKDVVSLDIGLGFLHRAIVDQHFNERGRLGRLLSALAQRPDLIGVGIDEDTALVVTRDQGIEVVGHGNITLVDTRQMQTNATDVGPEENLEILGLRLHVLPAGHEYLALPPFAFPPKDARRLPAPLHQVLRMLVEPGPMRG